MLRKSSLAIILGVATLLACQDEQGTNFVAKEEAQASISTFNSEATAELAEMQNAEGFVVVGDFLTLLNTDDPFGRKTITKRKFSTAFRHKTRQLKHLFTPGKRHSDGPFDFESKLGVYEWDSTSQTFTKTGEANVIKILFPAKGSSTNNAELKITEYAEVAVADDHEDFDFGDDDDDNDDEDDSVSDDGMKYLVTRLAAEINIDNEKVASVDLTATYDESGDPLTGDIDLFFTPYTFNLTFDVSNSTTSSVQASLSKSQDLLIDLDIKVTYADADKEDEDITKIAGYVQFLDLKIVGDILPKEADASEFDWNDVINLAVYKGSEKLGDVVIVSTDNDGEVAYIQYADGTKEKLETLFSSVSDQLDELLADLDLD